MNLIEEAQISAYESSDPYFMPEIEINKNSTRRLIEKIGKLGLDDELLKVVNCLGQNIESIDTVNYSYVHLGQNLQFGELSRGEQVFTVSFASMVSHTPIYLRFDILQLTKTALRKYYEIFKECDCINIICESQPVCNYLMMAMRGEII